MHWNSFYYKFLKWNKDFDNISLQFKILYDPVIWKNCHPLGKSEAFVTTSKSWNVQGNNSASHWQSDVTKSGNYSWWWVFLLFILKISYKETEYDLRITDWNFQ